MKKNKLANKDFIFFTIAICGIAGIAYFIANVKTIKFPVVSSYNLSYSPRANFMPAEGVENKLEYKNVE